MISVILNGGLGNQMFQYAAGRALALQYGVRIRIETSFFKVDKLREEELGVFSVDVDRIQIPIVIKLFKRFWNKLFKPRQPSYYFYPHQIFDINFEKLPPNITIEGYWQSEKYFKGFEAAIRQDFQFRNIPNTENQLLIQQISKVEAISLHVRRGDYVQNPTTLAYHGVCGLDYYERAIAHIESQISEPHYFVFSDDIDWCQMNLSLKNVTFVGHNTGKNSFEDMRLMSLCQHHIIANSSFSWWGAWLNPKPDKIVIAPQQWFADTTIDTSDLVPETWLRL